MTACSSCSWLGTTTVDIVALTADPPPQLCEAAGSYPGPANWAISLTGTAGRTEHSSVSDLCTSVSSNGSFADARTAPTDTDIRCRRGRFRAASAIQHLH